MMCGSPGDAGRTEADVRIRGFVEGSHNTPGHFVIEKAFVER